ncbi:MAG: hypothetical protein Q9204_002278 [Flavoplaca sp. TL-2023a]
MAGMEAANFRANSDVNNAASWVLAHILSDERLREAVKEERIALKLNCAWDVMTNCLIMLILFSMLKGVQMRRHRKLALGGIFSLVVITMVFAIIHTALVGSDNKTQPDSSWCTSGTRLRLPSVGKAYDES